MHSPRLQKSVNGFSLHPSYRTLVNCICLHAFYRMPISCVSHTQVIDNPHIAYCYSHATEHCCICYTQTADILHIVNAYRTLVNCVCPHLHYRNLLKCVLYTQATAITYITYAYAQDTDLLKTASPYSQDAELR